MSDLKISQTELAERTGLKQPNINRILGGKQSMQPRTLEKFANGLGVTVWELYDDSVNLSVLNNSVNGYLEFNGEITRITSLNEIKKWLNKYEPIIENAPKEYNAIFKRNDKNKDKVEKSTEKYDFSNIDFYKNETIDCSKYHVWSFRKAEDKADVDGEMFLNNLGNMCKGYPFTLNGEDFSNSESAYICGMFSNDTDEHKSIQKELQNETNGYSAKKAIRRKYEDKKRPDWEEYNVEWMKYVVWTKTNGNANFKELLMKIPSDAIILENSSFQNKASVTSTFWGAKNEELKECVKTIEKYIDCSNPYASSKELANKKNEERNKIKYIGSYVGVNCMGKILKMCQLALLNGTEPNIDYDLLRSKQIYLFGKLLTF